MILFFVFQQTSQEEAYHDAGNIGYTTPHNVIKVEPEGDQVSERISIPICKSYIFVTRNFTCQIDSIVLLSHSRLYLHRHTYIL